ncbi:unnamed protein product, partial [Rotaria sp. Silwood1]
FGETQKLSAMEGTFVYHGVKHGHGYISQQCTINLVKDLFASCSSTAKNLACAKTKSRAVACNVLAPYFTSKLIDDISEARFYSISFDASNKGNIKTYPFTVQYFSDVGVKRGILQFVDDPRESASDVFNNAMKVIENYQLDIRNLTSIGADNANVNFGEHHSVFKLFKDLCPCLVKGNCYAHVLHNGVKHAHDDLLIDVELILKNVLVDIQRAELKLQRVYTTAVDLYGIISNLIKKLEQRLNDKYFGSKTHSILNQLMVFNEDKAKQLQDSFQSFIECVIKYIDSYFDRDRDLFQKLSAFDYESNGFLKWNHLLDVINMIKIDGLDRDELYNEYCEIKFIYDEMKNKNVKINEQIKLYISSKNSYNPKSIINSNQIPCDANDDANDGLLNNGARTNEYIQSDQLWSYLLNIKPKSTPNMKLVIAYVFSIPCSNAFVESIF